MSISHARSFNYVDLIFPQHIYQRFPRVCLAIGTLSISLPFLESAQVSRGTMLALLHLLAAEGFTSPSCSSLVHQSSTHRVAPAAMMAAKGFGKVPEKPKPKPPSEGKKKRDAAAAQMDKLKVPLLRATASFLP